MKILMRLRHAPVRLATGAFILDAGINHTEPDEQTAQQVHGMASGTYPFLSSIDPMAFTRLLGYAEAALGAALLTPVVPSMLAGAGLVAFSGGLLGMYLRTPGMRREQSLRPTPDGIPLAKDSWMLAIGAGLILDELLSRARQPADRIST
ncbi:hypothetical protein [Mycolicibacter sinensis]|uniref:DoxX family protein n=1 Tax=Mycolicibacter sinensis (strain JDM601) TaxID=875328 RepID=A0A1A3U0L5_MYCSD|nr:hypothetical protein [Mycolicibacter sinensis]OBK88252.1 hypothetical protein A5648_01880 [Mycolicibacter sinensis]